MSITEGFPCVRIGMWKGKASFRNFESKLCQRKKPPTVKTRCTNIPRTNKHLPTAAHRYTAREFKPYMEKRAVSPLLT